MVKIKRKVQKNLPQLIEWAWENDVRDTFVKLKSEYPAKQGIIIDNGGRLHLVGMDFLSKKNTFTVEVEEEITEDTVIDKLIVVYSYCSDVDLYKCIKVGEFTNSNVKSIYSLNDDYTTTLIWRDGKLIKE